MLYFKLKLHEYLREAINLLNNTLNFQKSNHSAIVSSPKRRSLQNSKTLLMAKKSFLVKNKKCRNS